MSNGLHDADFWLVDSLMVPASLHDVEGRFVFVNEAAERASGFPSSYWIGRHLTDRVPAGPREKVAALFRLAVDAGRPTDFETVFVDASGQLRGVRAQHLPLRHGDAVVGVLILAFDAPVPHGPIGPEPEPRLTSRQREVLELVAAGYSTAEIARRLTLSTETVRNHLRNSFRELRVHTRLEAIAAARRLGLLAAPALAPPRGQ
jgi:PAS domain S-box-containing protein